MTEEFIHEHRALIAVAEAGWHGSPCWHIFDYMCWKLRLKYPLKRDVIIDLDMRVT
jgi:hypothetical protein